MTKEEKVEASRILCLPEDQIIVEKIDENSIFVTEISTGTKVRYTFTDISDYVNP